MRLSLRLRVLLLVLAIYTAVFGAGMYVELVRRLSAARAEQAAEFAGLLDYTLPNVIVPGGELKVPEILRWPYWKHFSDAILVDRNLVRARGEIRPLGVFVNPVGAARRNAPFDRNAVLEDLADAIATERRVEGPEGVCLPVRDLDGRVWGGCWYRLESTLEPFTIVRSLFPWFLLSTLLLTLGTFFVLRRFVLDPVRALARGAERLSSGDLSARVAEPLRQDEITDLVRRFNAMAGTVEAYNRRLAQEVERATEQARTAEAAAMTQRRLAATGELAAGVAHEINNPLGGLLNAAESLSRENLAPDKRVQYHALLRSGLERIQATVGRLLRLAPREAQPQPVVLAQPVLDAIGLVQHRATQEGVRIEFECGGGGAGAIERARALAPVMGEQNELAQAVLNLLVNSLDALEGGPAREKRIDVSLAREGGELRLVVADNGPGVAEAELPRVADLFYTTKEVGKGTGLGLAIVHNVIASHGGRVALSSAPGRGFRVEIRIPVWTRSPRASADAGEHGASRNAGRQ